jgi:hypothetical protein
MKEEHANDAVTRTVELEEIDQSVLGKDDEKNSLTAWKYSQLKQRMNRSTTDDVDQ